MPTIPTNSGLRDNHTRGTVADFLHGKIQDGSRLSVVSAYFTIYAYDALKDRLTDTEHTPMKRYDLMNGINARGTYLCTQACLS